MDREIKYHRYKADFYSAYNSNGNNVELAIVQIYILRDIDLEELRTILKPLIDKHTI